MPGRSLTRVVALGAIAALSLTACANGSNGGTGGGGASAPTDLVISTDLPLQGASASTSESTNNLIKLYLDSVGSKAGNYNITLKTYDDSTAAKGSWDDAACAKNATDHVANTAEVAVMGTFNSGCAKIEVPTLNQDSTGPMLMVSHANTNPGLTKTWDTGEPDKYYPGGTRNFARVITTDDYQGVGAAAFATDDLKVKKVFVLNDNQTYGLGVAKAFSDNAKKDGLQVVGEQSWDAKQPNYTALFQAVRASGADLVYLGGIYDNNGGQLIKDKVAVLGPNDGAVKLMAPDGFTGYPDMLALSQSADMYLTFAGLTQDQLLKAGGAGGKLLTDYQTKYGKAPDGSYPLYGVAAMQVILDAISKSDGTRKSVTEQVLGGAGITIPADTSVLGKEIKIDPTTGDTSAKDLTIEIVKDKKETFEKSQSIS
ncbi:MAG: branched-chain amino acid ABC transporter substrate-binding protein [Janthinobacterium lividum]